MKAFPSAVGWGANTLGGRGGRSIRVTNLNDSGPGSFRDAVEVQSGPRIVLFEVGGWVNLESPINIRNPYLTIAAQTAPGQGIGLRVSPASRTKKAYLQINTSQVIIRGLRSRPGIFFPGQSVQVYYCLNIGDGSTDIIVDRCSFSWADDTAVQTWGDVRRITIQNSIISEAPNEAFNMGAGDKQDLSKRGTNISVIGNLMVHNRRRNPKIHARESEVKNNVIFNHRGNIYIAEDASVDIEGNVYLGGANTEPIKTFALQAPLPAMKIFVSNNITPERPNNTGDEWLIIDGSPQYRSQTRVGSSDYIPYDVNQVYETVLGAVGAVPMDPVDQRIIENVRNRTGAWIPQTQDQEVVGGYPELQSGPVPISSAPDGVPDEWKAERGISLDAETTSVDSNGDGYDDIENYINEPLDGVTFPPVDPDPDPDPVDCTAEYERGRREGFEEGKTSGYDQGYLAGHSAGFIEGEASERSKYDTLNPAAGNTWAMDAVLVRKADPIDRPSSTPVAKTEG